MKNISFDDLKDQVCVITGGYGVIGTALTKAISQWGAKVAIIGRNGEQAAKVAAEIEAETGNKVRGYAASVVDKEALISVKKQINEDLGKISLLINGAGGNSPKATSKVETMREDGSDNLDDTFFGLDLEGFDFVFDLNFKGTLLPSMIFSKDMLELGKGSILNVSSMSAYKPLTKIPAYSSAKAAVNSFTEWLSVHMAKTGIRVNAIAPGFFLTNQNRFLLVDEKSGNPTARGQKIINNTPMGRYGEVEELQGTTLFLLSDTSKFITGICVPIDGGYSAFGGI